MDNIFVREREKRMSDVKGFEISDILGLSQPLTKLIEVCSSAIGTVYKPRHERKMTDAKVYEIKQIGEAIRENSDLPVNYQYRNIGVNATDTEDLMQRAKNRWLLEEMKRQQNVEAVADNAYDELSSKDRVSEKPVDEDWKTRFFDIAKGISSEEMQHIWGKILAGEIEQPGSFSMRTLDVIRNLSQDEAKAFQGILPFLVQLSRRKMIIPGSSGLLEQYNVQTTTLTLLSECGLIGSENGNMFKFELNGKRSATMYSNGMIMFLSCKAGMHKTVTFGGYSLTKAGIELERILNYEPNNDFFANLASEYYSRNNDSIEIAVHTINYITESKIDYNDKPMFFYPEL